jgi:hypothetical protein
VIEPAVCLGDDLAAPGQMPADNFVSAAEIIAIDPFFCSSAPGACCSTCTVSPKPYTVG